MTNTQPADCLTITEAWQQAHLRDYADLVEASLEAAEDMAKIAAGATVH